MPNAAFSPPPARRAAEQGLVPLLLAALLLAGCAAPMASPSAPAGVAAPTREALPLDQAVVALAEALLASTRDAVPPGTRRGIVIDPLIDRATGAETGATRSMESVIGRLVRERYPALELKPFTVASLDEQPLILLGAITRVQAPGSVVNAPGPSDTYRIWGVVGDLRSGTILARPMAWVRAESVDPTPTAFFRDSPAWTDDVMQAAYLRTCSSLPGTRIDPAYLRGLRAQAMVAEAVGSYERGEMARARALYVAAEGEPGGQQARVLNGLYLTNWALGRRAEAEAAFGRLVGYGLSRNRLAVKLLFRPGGTEFVRDPGVSGPYPMWLRQIAAQAAGRESCLVVEGHASVTGSSEANDRLSLARAQAVRARLLREAPPLEPRSAAAGRGARQPIIGLGTDDMRDALDRRVEFLPGACPARVAGLAGGVPAG